MLMKPPRAMGVLFASLLALGVVLESLAWYGVTHGVTVLMDNGGVRVGERRFALIPWAGPLFTARPRRVRGTISSTGAGHPHRVQFFMWFTWVKDVGR